MCSGKPSNRSFKLKQRDIVPEEEWVVVKNTHEPLIDEVTWARVQEQLELNKCNQKAKTVKSTITSYQHYLPVNSNVLTVKLL